MTNREYMSKLDMRSYVDVMMVMMRDYIDGREKDVAYIGKWLSEEAHTGRWLPYACVDGDEYALFRCSECDAIRCLPVSGCSPICDNCLVFNEEVGTDD